MVVTIVVIVGIIGIGVGILAYRYRTEKGIDAGITSFRRELHALAPRPDEDHRSSGPERPPEQARGLTIMPGESDEPDPESPGPDAAEPEPEREAGTSPESVDDASPPSDADERPDT